MPIDLFCFFVAGKQLIANSQVEAINNKHPNIPSPLPSQNFPLPTHQRSHSCLSGHTRPSYHDNDDRKLSYDLES